MLTPLFQTVVNGGVPPETNKFIAPVLALLQSNALVILADKTKSCGSRIVKVLEIVQGLASVITTEYVPGPRLFLVVPAGLPSLQTKFTGAIPPTKFKAMLPSFAPKHEILVTIGFTSKIGGLGMFIVNDF